MALDGMSHSVLRQSDESADTGEEDADGDVIKQIIGECKRRLPNAKYEALVRVLNVISSTSPGKGADHPLDQMRPLFADAPDLYMRLCNSLSLERKVMLHDLPSSEPRHQRARHFLERLHDNYPQHLFNAFVRVYNNYECGHLTTKELDKQLKMHLQAYPELHDEYSAIASAKLCIEPGTEHHWLRHLGIPEWCLTDEDRQRVRDAREGKLESQLDFIMSRELLDNIADIVPKRIYNAALRCLHLFACNVLTKTELESLMYTLMEGYQGIGQDFSDLIVRCEAFYSNLAHLNEAGTGEQVSELVVSKQDLLRETLTDLDLQTSTEAKTPSYRTHPPAVFRLPATRASQLDRSVLNSEFVMVSQNKDTTNLATMNPYEEAMHQVEDDRHELDLVIELCKEAISELERIDSFIKSLPSKNRGEICIGDDESTSIKHRCVQFITRMYGQRRSEVQHWIYNFPSEAVPVILKRLYQKISEWRALWQECQPIWLLVDEFNHDRGIDQRHTIFRQAERRCFNSKCIISAAHERRKHRSSNSFEQSDEPDLVFPGDLREEHDDAFMMLRFHLGITCDIDTIFTTLEEFRCFIERGLHGVPRSTGWNPVYGCTAHKAMQVAQWEASNNVSAEGEYITQHDAYPFRMDSEPNTGEDVRGKRIDDQPSQCWSDLSDLWYERDSCRKDKGLSHEHCGGFASGEASPKWRPLHTASNTMAEGHAGAFWAEQRIRRGWSVMYSTDILYIIMQLHKELLLRIRLARRCAVRRAKEARNGQGLKAPDASVIAHDWNSLYKHFLLLLFRFVAGLIERQSFEDCSRTLLGENAYPVFHMDLLLHKLSSHIQTWRKSNARERTMALYKYEQLHWSGDAATYRANASMLFKDFGPLVCVLASPQGQVEASVLNRNTEEPIPRVEDQKEDDKLSISRSEVLKNTLQHAPKASKKLKVDGKPPVLLRRSLPAGDLNEAAREVYTHNGMELTINLSDMKKRTVPETEDVMYRPLKLRKRIRRKCTQPVPSLHRAQLKLRSDDMHVEGED